MKDKQRKQWSVGLCNASILLYVLWLMLPALQCLGGAVCGVAAIGLFALGVLLDTDTWKEGWLGLLIRAACIAVMPLLLFFFLGRGGDQLLAFFVQHGMFWFPLVFCGYARQRGDRRLWRGLKPVLLTVVGVTVLTSVFWLVEGMFFRGDKVYAYARTLGNAEPGYEDFHRELMLKNICGYDFTYAMVAALPLTLIGVHRSRGGKRAAMVGLLALQVLMILLSQYTYAMVFAGVILVSEVVGLLIRALSRGRVKLGPSLLLGLLPLAVIWLLRMPLLSLATGFCQQAGLDNFAFSLEQLMIALQGGATDEYSRLAFYQLALEGIGRSPFVGSLFGGESFLSRHSDLLDLLSGMGLLGAGVVCGLIYGMGWGSLRGIGQNPNRAHLAMMWLAVLVVALLGTVCYSREVMAVAALGTLLVLEGPEPETKGA